MDSVVIIKVISLLLYPLGLAVFLVALGVLIRLFSRKKRTQLVANVFYVVSFFILVLFSNPQIGEFLVKSLESQHPQKQLADIEPHDVIIVLGGGLRIPLPPAKHSQLNSASDRYWYATRLFKAGKAKRIILAGGNIYKQAGYQGETYYAAKLMQEWGVPASAIIIEDQSRTTEQNRNNVMRLMADQQLGSALLVTSAMHMPRSYALFEKTNFGVTPASADVIVRNDDAPTVFSWLPSVQALTNSTLALHEYYGKWFAELKVKMSSD